MKHWSDLSGGIEEASASLSTESIKSQEVILKFLFEYFCPESTVDVGCGSGHWTQTCHDLGVSVTHAFDFVDLPGERNCNPEFFYQHDLSQPISIQNQYDLAISMEVAEHIPAHRAEIFIDNLCSLADVVLFSAALPYQQGIGHVNEHWVEYWTRLFADRGYLCLDIFRQPLWNDLRIHYHYRQNTLLYINKSKRDRFEKQGLKVTEQPLSLVHPELLIQAVNRALPAEERRMESDAAIYYNSVRSLKKNSTLPEHAYTYGQEDLWWDARAKVDADQ